MKNSVRIGIAIALACGLAVATTVMAGAGCGTTCGTKAKTTSMDKAQATNAAVVTPAVAGAQATVVGTKTCTVDGKTVECTVMSDGTCLVDGKTTACPAAHATAMSAEGQGSCSAHGMMKAEVQGSACGATQASTGACSMEAQKASTGACSMEAQKASGTSGCCSKTDAQKADVKAEAKKAKVITASVK